MLFQINQYYLFSIFFIVFSCSNYYFLFLFSANIFFIPCFYRLFFLVILYLFVKWFIYQQSTSFDSMTPLGSSLIKTPSINFHRNRYQLLKLFTFSALIFFLLVLLFLLLLKLIYINLINCLSFFYKLRRIALTFS